MKKIILAPLNVWKSKPYGFSQAVLCEGGRLLFISGQVGLNLSGDIVGDMSEQTKQAFENLKNMLNAAGATFDNIVKITCYPVNMSDLPKFEEIESKYIKKQYPASTVIEVKILARKELLVEIEAIAIL